MNKEKNPFKEGVFEMFSFLFWLPLFSGFLVIGWQSFHWLKVGEWVPITVCGSLDFCGDFFGEWMQNPQSWIGVQKILKWFLYNVPLSLYLIIIGVPMTVFLQFIVSIYKKDVHKER